MPNTETASQAIPTLRITRGTPDRDFKCSQMMTLKIFPRIPNTSHSLPQQNSKWPPQKLIKPSTNIIVRILEKSQFSS